MTADETRVIALLLPNFGWRRWRKDEPVSFVFHNLEFPGVVKTLERSPSLGCRITAVSVGSEWCGQIDDIVICDGLVSFRRV